MSELLDKWKEFENTNEYRIANRKIAYGSNYSMFEVFMEWLERNTDES